MVMLGAAQGHGDVRGLTQMGGEGAQWIGAAPFLEPRHFVQNLGDGTLHHSGSLAIRAAVAADLNVTYKMLYNGTVAMTGGQDVPGGMAVADLIRCLEAEGVKRVIVTADEPDALRRRRRLPRCARASAAAHPEGAGRGRGRDRADPRPGLRDRAAPRPQARQGGHAAAGCPDQRARLRGLRRLRREVRLPVGRAGRDRVRPQDAHPPELLQQGLLLPRGRLPVVHGGHRAEGGAASRRPPSRSWPSRCVGAGEARVRLVGIGGTGVVTVSQVLGMAAMLDGRSVQGLDMTGLSPEGRPGRLRRPHRRRRRRAEPVRGRRSTCSLGLDVVATATAQHLAMARPVAHRRGGLDQRRPDGRDGRQPARAAPDLGRGAGRDRRPRPAARRFFDAQALGAGAVRRPHAGQRDGARRGLAAGRDPGLPGRAAPGVRAQRRRGRAEPAGVRLGRARSWARRTRSRRSSRRRTPRWS